MDNSLTDEPTLDDDEESSIASFLFVPSVPSLCVGGKGALTALSGSSKDWTVAGHEEFLGAGDGVTGGVTGGLFKNISAREKTIRLVALW